MEPDSACERFLRMVRKSLPCVNQCQKYLRNLRFYCLHSAPPLVNALPFRLIKVLLLPQGRQSNQPKDFRRRRCRVHPGAGLLPSELHALCPVSTSVLVGVLRVLDLNLSRWLFPRTLTFLASFFYVDALRVAMRSS